MSSRVLTQGQEPQGHRFFGASYAVPPARAAPSRLSLSASCFSGTCSTVLISGLISPSSVHPKENNGPPTAMVTSDRSRARSAFPSGIIISTPFFVSILFPGRIFLERATAPSLALVRPISASQGMTCSSTDPFLQNFATPKSGQVLSLSALIVFLFIN